MGENVGLWLEQSKVVQWGKPTHGHKSCLRSPLLQLVRLIGNLLVSIYPDVEPLNCSRKRVKDPFAIAMDEFNLCSDMPNLNRL